MLNLNLLPLFAQRSIHKPSTVLIKAGISPTSVSKLLNNRMRVINLAHLDIICTILNCTPNDLLIWSANSDSQIPDTHALHKLRTKGNGLQLQETLKTMTLEQLNQIAALINQQPPAQ